MLTRREANNRKPSPHWVQRCADRGVPGCPAQIYRMLLWARANDDQTTVDRVKVFRGSEYWRFVIDGVRFYAVFRGSKRNGPVTVMTHEMYRNKRWASKKQARGGWTPVIPDYVRREM